MSTSSQQAAWLPDPRAHHRLRYWDGHVWTDWVADGPDAFNENGRRIIVHRRRFWLGFLVSYRVTIDGHLAARISSGETRSFSVTPGTHRVRVKQTYLASRELEVTVPPDAQLECGVRGGSILGIGLGWIHPRRTLALERFGEPDRLSVALGAASICVTVALWIAAIWLATWLAPRIG